MLGTRDAWYDSDKSASSVIMDFGFAGFARAPE